MALQGYIPAGRQGDVAVLHRAVKAGKTIMSRAEIVKILKAFKEKYAEQYGIASLGLFGSTVRDENHQGSDIDIVVRLKKQDLFNIIGIKQDLEEMLHTNVDVISYRETMNSFLKNRIDKEALYV